MNMTIEILDHENVGIDTGIVFLSCLKAEICPKQAIVNGGHLEIQDGGHTGNISRWKQVFLLSVIFFPEHLALFPHSTQKV